MTLIAGSYEKFIWGFSLKTQKNKSASEENPNLNTKTIALNSLFSYPSHTAPIKTLAVSGPVAVSGGGDECIKIYDLVTSSEIGSVLTTATTTSLAFYSPSDLSFPRNLVAGTDSGTVEIYDADPFVHLKSVKVHKRAVADVAVHRSGRLALSVGRDGRLAMVNLLNGRRTFCSRLDKEAGLVKYGLGGSAGKDMFFMGVEQKVYVHDSEDARILMEFEARSKVLCIAPGENGLIFTGGEDRCVTAWDTSSGKSAYCIENAHNARVKGVVVLGSKKVGSDTPYLIASASSDGVIRVWDVRMAASSQTQIPVAETETKSRLTCLAGSSVKCILNNLSMESNKDEIRNNDGSLLVISSESRKISSQKKDISHSNAGISKIPKVIVIGGGFAGIAAARALTDASFEVILLESRDRIGGRVCTDYSFGFPVDMGASWLHGVCDENPLAHVIGRLGLPLYRTSGDNSVLYDHDLESYALFDTNGNQIPQELVVRVGEVFENILQETVILSEECTNDMSMHHALLAAFERRPDLRLEGLAGKVLQWYMCRLEGWFATDADTISVKFWNKEELLPGGHGLMIRGYQPVINELAKVLDVRLNHRVSDIAWGKNGVRVSTSDGKVFSADAAVIAIPLGVLKSGSVTFQPRLPEWKETVISDIGVGNENKIALHFDNVFWPNVEFIGVVASNTYGCSYFLNLHKATGHPVLVYMPAGKLACDVEKMSDEDAVNMAFLQLKRILPNATKPIQYLVSHWGTDTNSLGAYSHIPVDKTNRMQELLRIPVDNLFFAGEATSMRFPGTVHGAFNTGVMAAEECRLRVVWKYADLDWSRSVMGNVATAPLLISRI